MYINIIQKILTKVEKSHPRTRKAHINTIAGLFIKGGGMLISLMLVPITIDYLSKATYGTWITISSVVTMLTFFDIGIGNGLRNKLSEAIAQKDTDLARSYISTAYASFSILQFGLIILVTLVLKLIPLQRIFNTNIDSGELHAVVLIAVISIAIKLLLDILSYVLLATQEPSISGLLTFLANVLVLIGTYVLKQHSHGNLTYLALITALSPIIVLFIASLFLYNGRIKLYKPSFNLIRLGQIKGLLSLGYKFFAIQITVIVIFYTDNLIVTQLFGPESVTIYNICFRYFNAANTIFAIGITPYWSAFTEAYVKRDLYWMNRTYIYLQKLWIGLTIIVMIMVVAADKMYNLWLGDKVTIPHSLNICMGLFVVISCWNNISVAVANGVGKVRLQLYYSFASAFINIPLAIYFGRTLKLGSAGVILGTSVSLLIGSAFSYIQAKKILSENTTGIWNQ